MNDTPFPYNPEAAKDWEKLKDDIAELHANGIMNLTKLLHTRTILMKTRGLSTDLENYVGRLADQERKLKEDFLTKHEKYFR